MTTLHVSRAPGGVVRLAAWTGLLAVAAGCAVLQAPGPGEVALVPAAPRVLDGDLVCAPAHDEADVTWEIAWLREGLPADGAVDGVYAGDTVPEALLTAGSTWTCLATPVRDGSRGPQAVATATVAVPSVLLVVLDDVGYGDLGAYGGEAPTPRLDALAAGGVRFDAAYAPAPVCSPSRAGLFTGRNPARFGLELNLGDAATVELEGRGLPYDELTVAELAQAAGLTTGLIGKWHLGIVGPRWPGAKGFDDHFGFLSGQRLHVVPGLPGAVDVWSESAVPRPAWPYDHWSDALIENGVYVPPEPEAHLTDLFADAASAWIGEADGPFLLTLSFLAAHEPIQATAAHLALVPDPPADRARHGYLAMLAAVDAGIGRVLDALAAAGRAEDTVVVVVSDNGCPDTYGLCDNGGLAGGKVRLTEGGLRVPMIVRWPGRLPEGRVEARAVSLLDIFPTVATALGAALPDDLALDGVDLLPFLHGGSEREVHPHLAWRLANASAVRRGPHKLTRVDARVWLHDLDADPEEAHDLSAAEPGLVRELTDLLDVAAEDWQAPSWSPQVTTADYHGESRTVGY